MFWLAFYPATIPVFQEGTLSAEQHYPLPGELHIFILGWEDADRGNDIVYGTSSSSIFPLDRPDRLNYANIPQNNYKANMTYMRTTGLMLTSILSSLSLKKSSPSIKPCKYDSPTK